MPTVRTFEALPADRFLTLEEVEALVSEMRAAGAGGGETFSARLGRGGHLARLAATVNARPPLPRTPGDQ